MYTIICCFTRTCYSGLKATLHLKSYVKRFLCSVLQTYLWFVRSTYVCFWFSLQPEVRLDFDISKSTLYRLVYRFVNLNDNAVKGEVTLRPDALQEITQYGEISFAPSTDPAFADVGNKGGPTTFVLNPGQWTVMIKANDSIFLVRILCSITVYPSSYLNGTHD